MSLCFLSSLGKLMRLFQSKTTIIYYLTVSISLFLGNSMAASEERGGLKSIQPIYSVEDIYVRDFAKSMLQVFLFYGELSDSKASSPNFIFISGGDYLIDGKLNIEKMKEYFPEITNEEVEEFSGGNTYCLVFELPLADAEVTVGVNDTESARQDLNYSCFLDTLAFFIGKDRSLEMHGDSVREYARNIIDELRSRVQ